MASTTERVTIHYRRLPGRLQDFDQRVVARTDDCVVTYLDRANIGAVMRLAGRIILEPASPIVWFTFPGRWHDIGRFHDASGRFTGLYANVLTPVQFAGTGEWETTDLFLDVWVGADGSVQLLDESELDEAEASGWVDADLARAARREAASLLEQARAGTWPPAIVARWTLERVRETFRARADGTGGAAAV